MNIIHEAEWHLFLLFAMVSFVLALMILIIEKTGTTKGKRTKMIYMNWKCWLAVNIGCIVIVLLVLLFT